MSRLTDAAFAFADIWAIDTCLTDNAVHFTLTEASVLADLLTAAGHGDAADRLLEAWIEAEIEDGEAVLDEYVVIDHALVYLGKESP